MMPSGRHLLDVAARAGLLAVLILTGTSTSTGVTGAFSEAEDDSSETRIGSLEQTFSLYPEDWTEEDGGFASSRAPDGVDSLLLQRHRLANSEDFGSLLLLRQRDGNPPPPGSLPRPADDFSGGEDYLEELQLDGGRTSTSSFYISSTTPQSQVAKGKPVRSATLTAATPPLTRLSELFRSMLERFGVLSPTDTYYRSPEPTETEQWSRQRSYSRFRPHFVSTAKGLRNIPAQLNDGQLVHAPDDATDRPSAPPSQPSSSSSSSPSSSASGSRRPAGESATTVGRPSGTTPSSTITNLFNSFKRKIKAIYPGTVWCGDGNQAKSEDDIGFFYLTDSCCRAHDLCPITIAAGEQFNRLRNNGHFTRSHCDCDKQFYNCLKNADTLVSRQIGYTYFNLLKPQCFRYEHPKVSCTKRKKGKCLTYVVNEQQSKQWQWFDNLIY